jgi:photosystem II stability/assembly factor-like uncharacterized protein
MWRVLLLCGACAAAAQFLREDAGIKASLRGVSVGRMQAGWVSGSQGTVLMKRIGETWRSVGPPGVADLDFRDIEAFDEQTAYILSAGPGRQSRIYKTVDGGRRWSALLINSDPEGFWDAIDFWDETHGIVVGDPVDGRFTVLTTADGKTWQRQQGPKAEKGEAIFAASGTSLAVRGVREAWFATGGAGGGRVFHTEDAGRTWSAVKTPVRAGSESSGIFSIAFAEDGRHGVVVGGDYMKPDEAGSAAITSDGGKTWTAVSIPGYRSAVVSSNDVWYATGTSGSSISRDNGKTWEAIALDGHNAISLSNGMGWAVGVDGKITYVE